MTACVSSFRRSRRTLDDMPPQRSCSSRKPSGPPRSSHRIRNAQRRPRRSKATMSGRPVRVPRAGCPGCSVGMRIASLVLRNSNRYVASTTEANLATAGDGSVAQIDDGSAIVEAFVAGDSAAMTRLLAPDATFHSPVTDYHGRERVAEVLSALVEVVTDVRVTSVLE